MFATHRRQTFYLLAGTKPAAVREYNGGSKRFNCMDLTTIMPMRGMEVRVGVYTGSNVCRPIQHEWARHTWGECLSELFKAKHDV